MDIGSILTQLGPGPIAGLVAIGAIEVVKRARGYSGDQARGLALIVGGILGAAAVPILQYGAGETPGVVTAVLSALTAWVTAMGGHNALGWFSRLFTAQPHG